MCARHRPAWRQLSCRHRQRLRIWRAFGNQAGRRSTSSAPMAVYGIRCSARAATTQSERVIQQLLSEAGGAPVAEDVADIQREGRAGCGGRKQPAFGGDLCRLQPGQRLRFSRRRPEDAPSLYRTASALPLNRWSLAGVWTIGGEFATLNEASGSIAYRFHARDLHLVLGSFLARPPDPLSRHDRWRASRGRSRLRRGCRRMGYRAGRSPVSAGPPDWRRSRTAPSRSSFSMPVSGPMPYVWIGHQPIASKKVTPLL